MQIRYKILFFVFLQIFNTCTPPTRNDQLYLHFVSLNSTWNSDDAVKWKWPHVLSRASWLGDTFYKKSRIGKISYQIWQAVYTKFQFSWIVSCRTQSEYENDWLTRCFHVVRTKVLNLIIAWYMLHTFVLSSVELK